MISIFRNLNQFAKRWKSLDAFAIFCARYLIYLLVLFLFVSAFYFHSKGLFVYPLLSGFCAAFVFDKIIYIFFKEARPATIKSTKVLIPVPKNPSFPSRHASVMFGMSFYIFFYSYPLALIFLVCSCLIGVGRVFCGVHWFRDIVAGGLVGFLSATALFLIINLIK